VTLLLTVAFFSLVTGILLLFHLSPFDLLEYVSKLFKHKQLTMKQKIKRSVSPKKIRGIRRIINDSKAVLKATNKSDKFAQLCVLSLFLCVLGVIIASSMSNFFLVPVLAIGFALLPFLYVLLSASTFKKQLNGELEIALSTITTSYNRTENIITAVEENIIYLNSPVREVFEKFLAQTKMINPDVNLALEQMKDGINNSVFHEWLDAMIVCQNDRNLKSTLNPIVNKLSDMRIVTGELDYLMYEPFKEYVIMALTLISVFPVLYGVSKDAYNTLMYTPAGQIIFAFSVVVILLSLIGVVRHTRPIEYKR